MCAKKLNFTLHAHALDNIRCLQSGWVVKRVCHLFNSYTLTYNKHPHARRQVAASEWAARSTALKKWCKFPAASLSLTQGCSLPRGWFIGEVKGDEKLTLLVLAQCGLFRRVASCAAQQTHYRRIQIDTSLPLTTYPLSEQRAAYKN